MTTRSKPNSCPAHWGVWMIALVGCLTLPAVAADEFEKEPIEYSNSQPSNLISELQGRIERGEVELKFEEEFGYLRSLLKELKVPLESQTLVFSKTSFQRSKISPSTPRAVYFADDCYIGYCQNGEVLEISAVDPQLGAVFYSLEQNGKAKPKIEREWDNCLICHGSSQTQNVPGHLIRSIYSGKDGMPILSSGSFRIDHTSPFENRWGGWYVTGTHGKQKHLGNLVFPGRHMPEQWDNEAGQNVTDLRSHFSVNSYLTPHSDLVALMVMEHQAMGHNLLTRANFTTKQALHYETSLNKEMGEPEGKRWRSTEVRIKSAGDALVEYLLFAKEAPLTEPIAGTSGFAERFAAIGPFDSQGRSLRQFDLQTRMFKYPCSYLIYTESFDQLPGEMKAYVYQRLWDILNGKDDSKLYSQMKAEDRTAILEIIIATKQGLPQYWKLPSAVIPAN